MADALAADTNSRSSLRYFVIGWTIIGLVFGGLLAWSVFAPFEGAVMAHGTLTVESRQKAVQHLEGGIVAEILTSEGEEVEAGDLLIRLDGTAISAQLASLDAQLIDLVSREARLIAERDGDYDQSLAARNAGMLDAAALDEALKSQQTLMQARTASRETQISILTQRIQQLRSKIEGLKAEVASKSRQRELIEEELESLSELVERELVTRPRILSLQRESSELSGSAESLTSEIAATQVQIGEAQLEKLRLTDGFREDVIGELTEVQTEIARLRQERNAAVDRLSRLEIRAPRSGRVIGIRTHTIGGVIGPGDPIMFIVPRDDKLIAMVRIAPQDIDKITAGQVARLRFSAFSQRETPEVEGEVLKISPDTVKDEETGAAFYEVSIALPSQSPYGEKFTLVPGMPVDAMLRTESRNVLSYLTKPLRDSLARTFRE